MSSKRENGNITSYTYDGTGRLSNERITKGSAVINIAYAYDNAGNRSSLTVTGTENYVTIYSYDKNNRLLKDSKKNNGASYEYLSSGLRLSKTVNGTKTNFVWDGNNIDFTVTSDETVSYARAPGFMRTGTSKELIGTRNEWLEYNKRLSQKGINYEN